MPPDKPGKKKTPPKKPPKKPTDKTPLEKTVPKKIFHIQPASGEAEGEKIIIYSETGLGKSTLASTSPNPVFLALDDGIRKLDDPFTGDKADVVPDVECFQDIRDALHQPSLFDEKDTIVIDTVTVQEDWCVDHVVATVPTDKGHSVKNIIGYGWGKGWRHVYDHMNLILSDLDPYVRKGKNVILIGQAIASNIPNPGGEDYLRDGPRLHTEKRYNVQNLYCEWADHIMRISYLNSFIKDKKVRGDTQRAIFVEQELYFMAKSRGSKLQDGCYSFENPQDNTVWQYLFGEDYLNG
jgi:hypothetical protein